jgi:cardiolipin synthase
MVGSVNLDNRSLFLNYEIATFLYSHESVAKLYSWADKILKETSKDRNHISNKPSSLFVESIVKVLTPLM